jgi:hypothetical protein
MVKSRKKRGGCGCSSTTPTVPNVPPRQFGGNTFSIRNYYGRENYDHAPTNPNMITSARNLPNMQSGGKSRRIKKRKQRKTNKRHVKKTIRSKKMVGGTALFTSSMNTNATTSFGTVDWASSGPNILGGTSNINPATYSQPIEKMYGTHNAPLS